MAKEMVREDHEYFHDRERVKEVTMEVKQDEISRFCKKCGAEVIAEYSECQESGELVVVDKQTQEPLVLNKGDKLCMTCSQLVDYYRRIKDC